MENATTLSVRVDKKTVEAEGIYSFELVPLGSGDLPPFSAGAHVDVQVGGNLVRQYSLCNDPHERHRYQIAILRDPGSRGGSEAMHARIAQGDVLQISPPKNYFPLADGARRSVLLAGGIGITPILSMAERLARLGADFELRYCTRSRQRTAFHERLAGAAFAANVHFHFDDGAPEQRLDLAALLRQPDAGTHLYVCGPAAFIEHVLAAASERGWSAPQIHVEYFGATAAPSNGAGFKVRIGSSGRMIDIPVGKTVTAALAEQGVAIPVACEQGMCGTCVTGILSGTPEHRDLFLSDAEHAKNDRFTPCCSRSLSAELVLDL